MNPVEVNKKSKAIVFKNIFRKSSLREILKLPEKDTENIDGDTVRISKYKKMFEKGYLPQWTEEVLNVEQSLNKYGKPLYKLTDWNKDDIIGTFYPEKIQKVIIKRCGAFRVEQILSSHRRGNKTEYLVKWFGYPNKFNS